VLLELVAAVVLDDRADEVILDIGRGRIGADRHEASALGEIGGEHPGPAQAMLEEGARDREGAAQRAAEQRIVLKVVADQIVAVVLQVRADRRAVDLRRDAVFLEMRAGSYA